MKKGSALDGLGETRAVDGSPAVKGGLPGTAATGELDLFAVALLLRSHLRFILLCALAGFLVMVAYTLHAKPRYDSSTSVIIPQVNPSAAGLALQAASGLDLLGGGFEIYIDILRSRSLAQRVIASNHLEDRWNIHDEVAAEGKLESETTFVANREGLLRVTVEDENPELAAVIANGFLTELENLNHQLSLTSAGLQRKYFEEQMVKEKNLLEDAEVTMQQSQERSGGAVDPQVQAQSNLGATEGVRAQLRAKQVELQALLQGYTLQSPEVKRVQSEIGQLEGQLGALQSGGGVAEGTGASRVPAQSLAYVRAAREVKFHEALFESLQKQDELFKEQEAKDFSQIEVLDTADVPKMKAWPPRTRYSLAGLFVGGVLGVALTLLRALSRTVMSNPLNRLRYHALVSGKAAKPAV